MLDVVFCIFAFLYNMYMDYSATRHQFHRLAEPSGKEERTAQEIVNLLQEYVPTEIHRFENSHNIIAVYDSHKPGNTILLRGDFDAVGIPETIELPYASENPDYSHKCGHDGHTTILLGVAEQLHLHPISKGKVLLFFQAAEETGEGCAQLLTTRFLDSYNINMVYALHNIPGIPIGSITCCAGSFTCAVISCEIQLHGRTAHAAEPQNGISPFQAATDISRRLLSQSHNDLRDENYQIVTLIESHIGETAYGVSAGSGVLRFTLRAKTEAQLQQLIKDTEKIVTEEVGQTPGLSSDIRWLEYFAGGQNSADAAALVRQSALNLGLDYIEKEVPFTWGEDFGLLTQHYPGALFGLGSGENCPPLHHQTYDFPDEIIENGVKMMVHLIHLTLAD